RKQSMACVALPTCPLAMAEAERMLPAFVTELEGLLAKHELANDAIVHKPKRIATKLGIFGAVIHSLSPRMAEVIMNIAFRMFPDSADKGGELPDKNQQQEMIAFAAMLRGIHF
ncbi:MAG: hypothetical protein ACRCUB_00835, partial [Plesiomonas shigelloides]